MPGSSRLLVANVPPLGGTRSSSHPMGAAKSTVREMLRSQQNVASAPLTPLSYATFSLATFLLWCPHVTHPPHTHVLVVLHKTDN